MERKSSCWEYIIYCDILVVPEFSSVMLKQHSDNDPVILLASIHAAHIDDVVHIIMTRSSGRAISLISYPSSV